MPRLLLVDDNPSIHKIAETLLASSDVQLVSCGSGAQAMALVEGGDRFDVALLDTSMMGMDGWALLEALRAHEATARMPVAMMAGVLDLVDPERLRLAPIQGFLKKPVELRDLGARIRVLMETPVPPPAPPAPPPAPEPEPVPEAAAFLTRPALRVPEALRQHDAEADLLLLGPDDLAAEEPHALDAADVQEMPKALQESGAGAEGAELDLEELDLEGLQGLTFPTSAMPALDAVEEPAPAAAPAPGDPYAIPEFLLADTLPETPMEASLAFTDQLPDLGPGADLPAAAGAPVNLLELGEPIDWSDDSDAMVGLALNEREPAALPPEVPPSAAATPLAAPEIITLSDILDPSGTLPAPVFAPAAPVLEEPAAGPVPAPATGDPLAALLADPVLMERLAKAVVARLGDQALRELAWEVMPELAQRLRQEAP